MRTALRSRSQRQSTICQYDKWKSRFFAAAADEKPNPDEATDKLHMYKSPVHPVVSLQLLAKNNAFYHEAENEINSIIRSLFHAHSEIEIKDMRFDSLSQGALNGRIAADIDHCVIVVPVIVHQSDINTLLGHDIGSSASK